MTIPKVARNVTEYVLGLLPSLRWGKLNREETELATHMRGNAPLYAALRGLIEMRLRQRANVPEPQDPALCKSIVARDRELQWLLGRLEFIYKSPINQQEDSEGEQPA